MFQNVSRHHNCATFVSHHACAGLEHPKNKGSYNTDVTAMLGTLVLFIFWPSFNGALAAAPSLSSTGLVQQAPQFFCECLWLLGSAVGCGGLA